MLEISWEIFKNNWKRYAWSSFVTFMSTFLVTMAFMLKDMSYDSLMISGIAGASMTIGRLALKAAFEGLKTLIIWIASKYK